jgi:hypothetical protein
MDELVYADLARAVRSRSILISAKQAHKEKVEEIKQRRKQLLMRATELTDSSPAMDQIHREIDIIDKQEFELHRKFKKTIQEAEDEINRITLGMVERRFGPNWNSDSVV